MPIRTSLAVCALLACVSLIAAANADLSELCTDLLRGGVSEKGTLGEEILFATQLAPSPSVFDAPNVAIGSCVRPLNPRRILVIEPTEGPRESTGLLIVLTGINGETDCLSAAVIPDAGWADEKDLVLAHVLYRNISFRFPYDFGKFQIVDVLRGLGAVLNAYPEIDRERIYLLGSSGGGLLALQVLQAAPHLFAEVSIHRPITLMTRRADVLTDFPNDPAFGWNTNLGFPSAQGALSDNVWERYLAEWDLRSPVRTFPAAIAEGRWPGLQQAPRVTLYHGTADTTVDPQHRRLMQEVLDPFALDSAWRFIDLAGANHSYNIAGAVNFHEPDAFLSRRPAPTLTVQYEFPRRFGWSWEVRGDDLSSTELRVLPPAAMVPGWELY